VNLPPKAMTALRSAGGKPVRFNNNQVWRMGADGKAVQIQ
jgi:hypothetical protein